MITADFNTQLKADTIFLRGDAAFAFFLEKECLKSDII